MQLPTDPLMTFYLMGFVLFIVLFVITYPSVRNRQKRHKK